MGKEAKDIRTPDTIVALTPLGRRHRQLSHDRGDAALFHQQGVGWMRGSLRPEVMVAVPGGISSVERTRAVIDATIRRRCRRLHHQGTDRGRHRRRISIGSPSGHMVVDIGGGTAEIAVLSLGGSCRPRPCALRMKLDAPFEQLRRKYGACHRRKNIGGNQNSDRLGNSIYRKKSNMEVKRTRHGYGFAEDLHVTCDDVTDAIQRIEGIIAR